MAQVEEELMKQEEEEILQPLVKEYIRYVFRNEPFILDENDSNLDTFIEGATNKWDSYQFSRWLLNNDDLMFGNLRQILKDNAMILPIISKMRKWNKDEFGEDILFSSEKEITLQLFFDNYCYYYVHADMGFDGVKDLLDIPERATNV
jgi:hypothetical protein